MEIENKTTLTFPTQDPARIVFMVTYGALASVAGTQIDYEKYKGSDIPVEEQTVQNSPHLRLTGDLGHELFPSFCSQTSRFLFGSDDAIKLVSAIVDMETGDLNPDTKFVVVGGCGISSGDQLARAFVFEGKVVAGSLSVVLTEPYSELVSESVIGDIVTV